jgi:hypothetical protein
MPNDLDATRIELANMDRSTVNEMLAEQYGSVVDTHRHWLAAFVYDHTRGNPSFIHDLLDYMLQEGLLQSGGDKWQKGPTATTACRQRRSRATLAQNTTTGNIYSECVEDSLFIRLYGY